MATKLSLIKNLIKKVFQWHTNWKTMEVVIVEMLNWELTNLDQGIKLGQVKRLRLVPNQVLKRLNKWLETKHNYASNKKGQSMAYKCWLILTSCLSILN